MKTAVKRTPKLKKLTRQERLIALHRAAEEVEERIRDAKEGLSEARTKLWDIQREIQELAGIRRG